MLCKKCFKCNKTKPLSAFYVHKEMSDGHLNKCKECTKDDIKKHRALNIDKIREYDRLRGFRGHAKRFHRNKARGVKVKKECLFCHSDKNIEKHHPDYSRPDFVVPLCRKCHRNTHVILKVNPSDYL